MSVIVSTKIINAERFKESTPYPITDLIRRVNDEQNRRWYHYQEDVNDRSKWFAAVTEIIKATSQKFPDKPQYRKARNLGTALHKLIEADLAGKPAPPPTTLIQAYQKWLTLKQQHEIHAIVLELPVISDALGFAGTIDILGTFDGKPTIFDLKTGYYKKNAGHQMSAYKIAYEEMTGRKDIQLVGLHVPRDDTIAEKATAFAYTHTDWTSKCFLARFQLWKDQEFKYLEKWGWRWLKQ